MGQGIERVRLYIEQGDGNYSNMFEWEVVDPIKSVDMIHISFMKSSTRGGYHGPYTVLRIPKSIWPDFVRYCQAQET